MQTLSKQQGLTLISMIVVLAVCGFLLMLVLKIGPIYLDHSKVINALEGIKESTDIATKTPAEIKEMLRKRFDASYVYDATENEVNIVKDGAYLKIEMDYQVVKPIIGNLRVVVDFDDVIEVGR
jgi:hypothetical protein